MDIKNEIKKSFTSGTSLVKLIYVNIALFLIIRIISMLFSLFEGSMLDLFVNWLSVPASLTKLLHKPWTILTYMFLHVDVMHILFNMLWLYWFGMIFLQYFNQKQLVSVYLAGGFCGGVLYILSYNIFPVFASSISNSVALGASASIMAIVISISFYVPDYEIGLLFFGRIKLKYIAIVSIIIDIISIESSNAGGHIAHLGGALFGYLYISRYKKGSDILKGFNNLMDSVFTFFKSGKKKMKVTYVNPDNYNTARKMNDGDYNKNKAEMQKEVDRILDKISKLGYNSLTKEEKELLFKQSQKL